MTNDEILEGNKLIAEFLGYKYYPHSDTEKQPGWKLHDLKMIPKLVNMYPEGKGIYLCRRHDGLRFFNSWDWLMLAVDKIEELTYRFTISSTFVRVHTCKTSWDDSDEYNCIVFEGKLKCTWYGVVEFIKWYNQKTIT